MEYLRLPFSLRNDYIARADDLRESIHQSIALLLSTRLGDLPFLPDYGCEIWQMAFTDIETANRAEVRASLRTALDRYERRLFNVSVSFSHDHGPGPQMLGIRAKVTGNFLENGQEQKFEAVYHLG